MWEKFDPIAILTAAVPVLVAFVSGHFAWVAGKKKASTEAQAAINSGFQVLVANLQAERTELRKIVDKQEAALDRAAAKIEGLEDEVRSLTKHIDRLESALRTAGLDIPPAPNR